MNKSGTVNYDLYYHVNLFLGQLWNPTSAAIALEIEYILRFQAELNKKKDLIISLYLNVYIGIVSMPCNQNNNS